VLLVFTRRGTEIDRRNGRVTRWWGLLCPMRSSVRPLDDFERVEVLEVTRDGRRRSYTAYPVRLAGDTALSLTVDEKLTHAGALELATDIARFLRFALVDRTGGSPLVRLAEEVGEPLRERQRDSGARVSVPDPPPNARSRVGVLDETIRFDIPAPGLGLRELWGMVFGLLLPIAILLFWLKPMYERGGAAPAVLAALAVLLVGLPILVFFILPLGAARLRTRVEASPQELRMRVRGLFFPRTRTLLTNNVNEVEVVDLASFKGYPRKRGSMGNLIVLRSDQGTLAFGAGLSDAELAWMRAVLWNVVAV
jgi:hypothetical protein